MTPHDCRDLAEEIIALFPNEVIGTYFVPPVRKCNLPRSKGKSIRTRGRVKEAFHNKLQAYRKRAGLIKKKGLEVIVKPTHTDNLGNYYFKSKGLFYIGIELTCVLQMKMSS